MPELPPELGPSGPPDAYGQDSSEERIAPRNITMEEAISRQLDRIAYLRSVGLPWSEALYQIRDMVVGLEDEEFWDGVPKEKREHLEKLQEELKKLDPRNPEHWPRRRRLNEQIKEIREAHEEDGWETHSVEFYEKTLADGSVKEVYKPSAQNLSTELRIIMRLLARAGVSWRVRRSSRLKPWDKLGVDDGTSSIEEEH